MKLGKKWPWEILKMERIFRSTTKMCLSTSKPYDVDVLAIERYLQ